MIMVASDFSDSADRALARATELAQVLGEPIEICHVHPIHTTALPPTGEYATRGPRAKEVGQAEVALADRVHRTKELGVSCEGTSCFGSPADELLARAAQSLPRLLVLGRHGRHSWDTVLLGSVAAEIAKRAPVPVLIVPPGG